MVPPKLQPSIQSISARIKTRAENTMAMIYTVFFLDPSFDSTRFTSNLKLKFWWLVLGITNHQFFAEALKSIDFTWPTSRFVQL